MPNERLRAALLRNGLTPEDVAAQLKVDPKTVERWVTTDRRPYRRYRYALGTILGEDETYLWPGALSPNQAANASESEIITVYPHRWTVPRDMWGHLFEAAEDEIGILVYSGVWLAEDAGLLAILRDKAADGVRVRLLFGDPEGAEVISRSKAEGIDDSLPGKAKYAVTLLRPKLLGVPGVEIRLHDTVLYNSIYRSDDELLVNAHVYGVGATDAPVLHLRRVAGGNMVQTYVESFDKVWEQGKPVE
jgi:transcriptional regulator with XRE-family HTH domain